MADEELPPTTPQQSAAIPAYIQMLLNQLAAASMQPQEINVTQPPDDMEQRGVGRGLLQDPNAQNLLKPGDDEEAEENGEEADVCEGLVEDDSFHGLIQVDDVNELLKRDGQYLIRSTDSIGDGRKIILSVFWKGAIRHVEIKGDAGGVSFGAVNVKPTVLELIKFHRASKLPIEGIVLVEPINRQAWELRRERIKQSKKLGEGAFGEVYRGTLKQIDGNFVEVAIKVPKATGLGKDVVGEAMREARIQKDYIHPNVVRLYGVSAERDPLMIVLEFVDGGSLDSYLKKKASLTVESKAMMAFDVSFGLSYLHSQNCIHRDIAARNCLVDKKSKLIKTSDFGLSSVGNVQIMDRTKPAPIRWLAPEVIKNAEYIKPSDIWSLGVLFWEIYTCCESIPYKELTLAEVQSKMRSQTDFHPLMPLDTQPDVKKLALDCWNSNPSKRPTAFKCSQDLVRYANKERFNKVPNIQGLNRAKKQPSKQKGANKKALPSQKDKNVRPRKATPRPSTLAAHNVKQGTPHKLDSTQKVTKEKTGDQNVKKTDGSRTSAQKKKPVKKK